MDNEQKPYIHESRKFKLKYICCTYLSTFFLDITCLDMKRRDDNYNLPQCMQIYPNYIAH